MPEEFEGEGQEDLGRPPAFFPYEEDSDERPPAAFGEPIEVQVEGVYAKEDGGNISRLVMLSDGERRLPITIGPYEAKAITMPMEGTRPDRPMTHDLLRTIAERLDATLDHVLIDDLWNTVFYAKLFFKRGDEEIVIDARPSDAIALALRFEAPVYVSDAILDAHEE